MDDKEKFIRIFSGLERAYGQTQSRAKNDAGKIEAKSWIQKEQITKEKWYDHLEGREPSLGIIPIREVIFLYIFINFYDFYHAN